MGRERERLRKDLEGQKRWGWRLKGRQNVPGATGGRKRRSLGTIDSVVGYKVRRVNGQMDTMKKEVKNC